jgi:hypothetical protein
VSDPIPLLMGALESDLERRPIPGSINKPCAGCGEPVSFSPTTLARPEAQHPQAVFMCIACAAAGPLDGCTIMPPTQAQIDEVRAAGHDATAWPLQEAWGQKVRRQ